jgi:hypothetical protein
VAYQFSGFFVAQPASPPSQLPANAVWRKVSTPFQGCGVHLPHTVGKTLGEAQIAQLAGQLGIGSQIPWLFLQYDTWGGELDFVYGLGVGIEGPFGPLEESARGQVEPVYLELMAHLGLTSHDALNFAPFERGFWGEQ